MLKQKVLIPIEVEDRKNRIRKGTNPIILFDNEEIRRLRDDFPFAMATHWLKEEEGYLFSEKKFNKMFGLDEPWPLVDVLKVLSKASEILLHKKDYDGPIWEEIQHANKKAKKYIKLMSIK